MDFEDLYGAFEVHRLRGRKSVELRDFALMIGEVLFAINVSDEPCAWALDGGADILYRTGDGARGEGGVLELEPAEAVVARSTG